MMYNKPSQWLLVNCDRQVPLGCEERDAFSPLDTFPSETVTVNVFGEDLGEKSLCYRYSHSKKGQCMEIKSISNQWLEERDVQEQGKELGLSYLSYPHL
jgi:hypothetical protein